MADTINFCGEELEVLTNVPIPPRKRSNVDTDDLANLQNGGYVFLTCDPDEHQKLRNRVSSVGKRHNRKFETRILDGGIGIWRVE
jgi:uncharacterized protein (DUF2249 family)